MMLVYSPPWTSAWVRSPVDQGRPVAAVHCRLHGDLTCRSQDLVLQERKLHREDEEDKADEYQGEKNLKWYLIKITLGWWQSQSLVAGYVWVSLNHFKVDLCQSFVQQWQVLE